jgi:hypothetical protein
LRDSRSLWAVLAAILCSLFSRSQAPPATMAELA